LLLSFFLMFDGCFPTKLSIFARVEGITVQPEIPLPALTTALAVTPAPVTLAIPELVRFALVRLSFFLKKEDRRRRRS